MKVSGTANIAFTALLLLLSLIVAPNAAISQSTGPGFERYLERIEASDVVPGADRLGPVQEEPRVAPAYSGEELVGYVYLNSDHVNSVGYSGRPIHILVGLDTEGTIVGLNLIDHHEPIVLIGIPEAKVLDYTAMATRVRMKMRAITMRVKTKRPADMLF